MYIDTHCHLDAEELSDQIPLLLQRARDAGVNGLVIPGVDPSGYPRALNIARQYDGIAVACGLHPMLADRFCQEMAEQMEAAAASAAAVGEIGLDYLCDIQRSRQVEVFRWQLRLALRHRLPVIIHCRKAFADLAGILREEGIGSLGGVMHAYSGSVEMAKEFISLGFYLAVGGTVTYTNAVRPVQVVSNISLDYLVLETDAPDITPEPLRGVINEPSFLPLIAQRVADIKGVSIQEVARATSTNAARRFRQLIKKGS